MLCWGYIIDLDVGCEYVWSTSGVRIGLWDFKEAEVSTFLPSLWRGEEGQLGAFPACQQLADVLQVNVPFSYL